VLVTDCGVPITDCRKAAASRQFSGEIDMAFEQRLAQAATAVEGRLAELLAPAQLPAVPERLAAGMRHAVLGGGKRFRPFLVLESATLFDAPMAAALDVAAALECIHCYSLVHDDLPAMDNDAVRRGQPTVWKAYDEWTAILVGDALLTRAFEITGRLGGELGARLTVELARASGASGMVGGQAIDLEADKRGAPLAPSYDHIRRLQEMKTGALIRFGCLAGPILAGAGDEHERALARYGDHLGFAFQISDDLLDAVGDAATVGKAVGKDQAAGKATLIGHLGIDGARRRLAEVEAAAVAALVPYGQKADTLVAAAQFMASRRS
jgi:farnesyl diphosphate synthase